MVSKLTAASIRCPDQAGTRLLHLQVKAEGAKSRQRAASLLDSFKQGHPAIVRAVRTRNMSQSVLMHKWQFVKSLAKAGLLGETETDTLQVLSPHFCLLGSNLTLSRLTTARLTICV
jgi:hypothetical protein